MEQPERIQVLLQQLKDNAATEAQLAELQQLLKDPAQAAKAKAWLFEEMQRYPAAAAGHRDFDAARLQAVWAAIHARSRRSSRLRRIYRRITAAAAVLIILGAGFYWWSAAHREQPAKLAATEKQDLLPGHMGAVLHLSNGRRLVLDSMQNGQLATQGNMRIIKENGTIRYQGHTGEALYNEVTTGRGRQWQLTLPDGTGVWLNAESSLKYPLHFTGAERIVEMTGEAYFEVAHHKGRPFKVMVAGQQVEDIGTAFNINAYTDEPALKATLLEGIIRVNGTQLRPGQQASVKGKALKVSDANTAQVMAWKNGLFYFHHTSLQEVMKQLARWYDVEVVYEGPIPDMYFGGKINRNTNASEVLTILEKSNIHFKIAGKKIIVMQ